MNFDELSKIVAEKAGVSICPICGTPFEKYHSKQRTCGAQECRRLWKNQYLRERRERMIAEDREAYNHYHATAQRKSRQKKKAEERMKRNYDKLQEHWDKMSALVGEDNFNYGKNQMERTLAQIPKIDVSLDKEKKP